MTSPERSESYKSATNELNEMMNDKVQGPLATSHFRHRSVPLTNLLPSKQSNTPLKDLHDQINHIINAKTTVSSSMNTDLTPEVTCPIAFAHQSY